jgi:uncharacterized pyridoxal phosphate-containing UPF0001 family protein
MATEDQLNDVVSRIAVAERQSKRSAGSVSLVAVSKTFDAER